MQPGGFGKWREGLCALDAHGDAHTAADAKCGKAFLSFSSFHFVK